MTKYGRITGLVAGALLSGAAAANNFSYTGTFSDYNNVQLFVFNVGASSLVTLDTLSYAGGVNAAGTTIARGGFDPTLALFNSAGVMVKQNDDGGANVAADAVTGRQYDSFMQVLLAPGSYTVSILGYGNLVIGPNLSNGFTGGAAVPAFVDITGSQRDSHWAFDVLNVNSAGTGDQLPRGPAIDELAVITAVPEPDSYAMLLGGFGLLGFAARRKKGNTAA